jgi:hypothetical protein
MFFALAVFPALAAPLVAAGLTFTTPPGWQSSKPGSSMRVAEFTLPRAAGDAEDAQLVIYFFGGSGGSVDANIDRWVGQMQQPDGKPSGAAAKKQTRTIHGLTVSLVDVGGTYIAETSPGSTAHHNKANFRLRAGVVQTPNGPYFIKLTGPAKTVTSWDRAYDQFLSSLGYQ